jgi:hypothetical protein
LRDLHGIEKSAFGIVVNGVEKLLFISVLMNKKCSPLGAANTARLAGRFFVRTKIFLEVHAATGIFEYFDVTLSEFPLGTSKRIRHLENPQRLL